MILFNQCKAEIYRMFRNRSYVLWSLVMPLVFYIIFTKVVNTGVADKGLWDAHFLMSITMYSVIGSAIMTLGTRLVQERTEGWTIYLKITPLSSFQYFSAKIISQSVVHIFSILVIFIAGILLNGVSLSIFQWILSGVWIVLGSLPFLGIGVLIGTMKRVDTASSIGNILCIFLAITGGLWMPMETLPRIIQTIGAWLPTYNYGHVVWEIIRGNIPNFKSISILLGYLIIFMVLSTYIRRKQEAV